MIYAQELNPGGQGLRAAYLARSLLYNRLHEIAVQEIGHAAYPFAGRFSLEPHGCSRGLWGPAGWGAETLPGSMEDLQALGVGRTSERHLMIVRLGRETKSMEQRQTGPPTSGDRLDRGGSPYFDRVVEVYKARLTLFATLMVAMVTLTGYAYQSKQHNLFFLAAAIPLLSAALDHLIRREFACPFLYKALLADLNTTDSEPITLLFLDFARGKQSCYAKLLAAPLDEEKRRSTFRQTYLRRGLRIKAILVIGGVIVEIVLGLT
jgi:hypothetical protein